jgi:predicted adenylyl cyclase CyaB
MPKNLELKIKMDSFYKTKSLLNNIGAEFKGELIQKDIYYKVEGILLKLRIENGRASLIKYLRNEEAKDRWSDFDIINFEEGIIEDFFKDIFKIDAVVEKKRSLFMYNNTRVHLDEVKYLGKFLELETKVVKGMTDAKERFKEIINLLDLDVSKQIRKSYKFLIMEKSG